VILARIERLANMSRDPSVLTVGALSAAEIFWRPGTHKVRAIEDRLRWREPVFSPANLPAEG